MIKLALHGATGRMGRTIARLCVESNASGPESEQLQLVGAICHADDPNCGRDIGELAGVGNLGVAVSPDVEAGLAGAQVVIDFSLPPALKPLLKAAQRQGVAVVSGTTGFTADDEQELKAAAQRLPVLYARNMSLGIQVLAELVEQAARRLGPEFNIEIMEVHHNQKVDSPSGTAKRLADAVAQARPDSKALYSREGQVGARTGNEVGVFGLRGGDVAGEHTVFMFGPSERIELIHRAGNRDIFARGALQAARWIVSKSAGLYGIADVLGQA